MQQILAITRRELIAYFTSSLAYLVMAAFLLLEGLIFFLVVVLVNDPVAQAMYPMQYFFGGTFFFWLFLLLLVPVVTMRLIAEERRSGTIEMLLTAPVTETQVIAAKFLAAYVFYLVLWLPTLVYPLLVSGFADLDPGPVAAGYLGIALTGVLFVAIGVLASALAASQLSAAVIAFAILVVLFILPLLEWMVVRSPVVKKVLGHVNVWSMMEDFGRGLVDTRHLVFTLSAAVLALFLATKALEARKVR